MPEPVMNADGSCPACARAWRRCEWHIAADLRADREKWDMLRQVLASARLHEIGRICARYELESDEGGTAYEKGARILDGKDTTPRW